MVAPDLCRALVSSKAAFNDVLGTLVSYEGNRLIFLSKVFKEDYRPVNVAYLGLYPPLSGELAMRCRIKAAVTRANKVRTSCNLNILCIICYFMCLVSFVTISCAEKISGRVWYVYVCGNIIRANQSSRL